MRSVKVGRISTTILAVVVLLGACSSENDFEADEESQPQQKEGNKDDVDGIPPLPHPTRVTFSPRHFETNTGDVVPKVILTNGSREISESTVDTIENAVKFYKLPGYAEPQVEVEKNVMSLEPGVKPARVVFRVKPDQIEEESWYMVAINDVEGPKFKVQREGLSSFVRSNGEHGAQFYPSDNPKITYSEICSTGENEATVDVSFSEPVTTQNSWSEVISVSQSGAEKVTVLTEKTKKGVGTVDIVTELDGFDISKQLTIEVKEGIESLEEGVPVEAETFEFVPEEYETSPGTPCFARLYVQPK